MEGSPPDWELKNLVKELTRGRELAEQLQIHLNNVQSSSHEARDFLLHRILYSYDQALSMLNFSRPGATLPPASASPGSPHSDDSDQDFKDQASRKRKAVEKRTEKVKVWEGIGVEGQLDDGYGWRKYGQKDILGAQHPRGYYRCTNRHSQGCMATKQVQRSDDDPTIFEITYKRKHTCNSRPNSSNTPVSRTASMPDPSPHSLSENPQQLGARSEQNQPEPLFKIQTSLRVITHDLGTKENPPFDPFNFPSSSTINPDNIMGNYSPNLLSPAASGSDYYPITMNVINDNYTELIPNFHTSESELSPIVAAVTSATNSPTVGTNLPFGSSEFDPNFSFGNPGYYP
ncbi:putative WRKY transcription factor 30 [Sesamum alatum]|uniref:WRKY transcription factor 30 n=1 Tax=Sesamum alatum TaxID=300844 RepID=A0AAE2CR13_9LAMI|nr:putative WRKY transcription factor 30 [Sesamum alatum]